MGKVWTRRRGGGGRSANSPRYVQQQLLLDPDEGGEDADDAARGGEHDEHPQVQLRRGPVVPVDAGDAALEDGGPVPRPRAERCGGHGGEVGGVGGAVLVGCRFFFGGGGCCSRRLRFAGARCGGRQY